MSSLLICARHFHRQRDRRRCFSVLCIVADGRDDINPGILKLLGSLGLVTEPVEQVDGADLHMSMHSCDTLLKRLGTTDPGDEVEKMEPLRAIVYLKQRNRGKLQSHSLFFNSLCRQLQPTYCFQIDNGTTMAADAVLKLVERLEDAPEIAALAPRIMPTMPEFDDDFMVIWQYLDFALQKSIVWPFEVATGHLSVVAGQACVFRWAALDAAEGGDRCGGALSPLEAYLRGTEISAPLEHLMYLAEDRMRAQLARADLPVSEPRTRGRMCRGRGDSHVGAVVSGCIAARGA
jgi:chitin synthase